MTKRRKWTNDALAKAVSESTSLRQVIGRIGLVPAGGNYVQVSRIIKELNINIDHFTGKGWRRGKKFGHSPRISTEEILVQGSDFQSFKLKRRLFIEGIKQQQCELCDWAEVSIDGRIPLELDHINGDRYDNRLENLRVLCPNCHSLQVTHRGRNKHKRRGGGIR